MFACPAETPAAEVEAATHPAAFQVPDGFRVELLYSVPQAEHGSWVSLAVDPRGPGQFFVCDQHGGLYHVATKPSVLVRKIQVDLGGAQGMVWAFNRLYAVVNSHLAQGPGLYTVDDADGDGRLDRVRLLKKLPTRRPGVEHGPHSIVVGPDQKSLYVVAGNMTSLPDGLVQPTRHRRWAEDQLLRRRPTTNGHATGLLAPGGWVCRTDSEAKRWELIAAGFRNPYDIAFNQAGELFTYDADMEMDIGTPWYRPTRICHVTSGGEFGWRFGTGKWPAYFPDSLPSVVDVGLGSPTGVAFGYQARFPDRYRRALYVCDWTNGILYAAHLAASGASYTAKLEPFLTAAPLPLTDLVVNDGALYFTIGGRKTKSGFYRLTYTKLLAPASEQPAHENAAQHAEARELRRKLEGFHTRLHTGGNELPAVVWSQLSSPDRHLRFAARVALEHAPLSTWIEKLKAETHPDAIIQACIAVARSGEKAQQPTLIAALGRLDWNDLSNRQRIDLLRGFALAFIRFGPASESLQKRLGASLAEHFPAVDTALNHELCRLLVYLGEPSVVAKSLTLSSRAATQEDRLFYGVTLADAQNGWNEARKRQFFEELNECERAAARGDYAGGGHFQKYVQMFRDDAAKLLTSRQRKQLANVVDAQIDEAFAIGSPTPRKFVRNWQVADLAAGLDRVGSGRSFDNGQAMFRVAACIRCHRFNNTGGIYGPDITKASKRYSRAVMLRELIEPSKQVSDQYQAHLVVTTTGLVYAGRILDRNETSLTIATDPLKPAHVVVIPLAKVDEIMPAAKSLMPKGLLNTLTKDDIYDLLAYIEAAGNAQAANFRRSNPQTPKRDKTGAGKTEPGP